MQNSVIVSIITTTDRCSAYYRMIKGKNFIVECKKTFFDSVIETIVFYYVAS